MICKRTTHIKTVFLYYSPRYANRVIAVAIVKRKNRRAEEGAANCYTLYYIETFSFFSVSNNL